MLVVGIRSAGERSLGEHPQDREFRQDDDFFCFTGLETPGSWLVLLARESGPDSVVLSLPPRDPEMERWTGRKVGSGAGGEPADRNRGCAIDRSGGGATGVAHLAGLAGPRWAVLLRGAGGPVPRQFCTPERSRALAEEDIEVAGPRPFLEMLRLVKDELRRLRRAIESTTAARQEAMRVVAPEMWE